jgi:sialic acid synthase SpsE
MIEISGRKIGNGFDPLIIVEIGINHGGSISVAFEMVDAAAAAGAEIVKHQTHIVEDEMSNAAKKIIPENADISIYEIMEKCALNEKEELDLKEYVESKGMIFISTPFSKAAADRLRRMDVEAYKIGSGECNNLPLLKHIAAFGKPMIVSTGMNDIKSIKATEQVLLDAGVVYAFLHTTNLYPTPPELVRLGAMTSMMQEFTGVEIGLSDHTTSNHACFGAVALGANILERHFTDKMSREGPDIINSMDPNALTELISGARLISKMRGGKKEAAKEEKITIDFAFATVVAIQDIKAGEILNVNNIWVKRPGIGGILATEYDKLLGKKVKNNIKLDDHLNWLDIN